MKRKYNSEKILALMGAFNVSSLTITRWVDNNDARLSSKKAKDALSKFAKTIHNKYNCHTKLWMKFKSNEAKKMYNDVMGQMLKNQSITCHPAMPKMTDDQWLTICHNASCYAAWAVRDEKLEKGNIVISITDTGKEVKKQKFK